MRVIAHLSFAEGADRAAFMAMRGEEAREVWRLYKEGALRDAALRTDLGGAVLTFEGVSEDEVRQHVDGLPAVKAGIFKVELIPVGPFLSYETLFAAA